MKFNIQFFTWRLQLFEGFSQVKKVGTSFLQINLTIPQRKFSGLHRGEVLLPDPMHIHERKLNRSYSVFDLVSGCRLSLLQFICFEFAESFAGLET